MYGATADWKRYITHLQSMAVPEPTGFVETSSVANDRRFFLLRTTDFWHTLHVSVNLKFWISRWIIHCLHYLWQLQWRACHYIYIHYSIDPSFSEKHPQEWQDPRRKKSSILMHDGEHDDKGDHHQSNRRGANNYSITASSDHRMRMSIPWEFSLLNIGWRKYKGYASLKINKCRLRPRFRGVDEPSANDPNEGHEES